MLRKAAEENAKRIAEEKRGKITTGVQESISALTKKQEEERNVKAIMASIQGPRFNVDFLNKVGSLYNRFSGWCSEQKEKVSQGIQWVGEKAGETWDAATSLTKNTIQSFLDHPVENLVIIGGGVAALYLTVASFGTLPALAAVLGHTAVAAYGGATVYAIYEYESGDKEKGVQDLKTIGLSAVTTLGALGAQGNIIGGSTTGMTMQPDGSAAVNGGQLIGYTLTLEGAAASNPAISEALGITQSAIVNGGGTSGTTGEKEKGDSEIKQKKNPTKGESEVWKKLEKVKGQDRKTSGAGKDKKYYEWDHTHNDIEVYDRRGNHLGSMDPTTGEMYKPAVPGRTIKIN